MADRVEGDHLWDCVAPGRAKMTQVNCMGVPYQFQTCVNFSLLSGTNNCKGIDHHRQATVDGGGGKNLGAPFYDLGSTKRHSTFRDSKIKRERERQK